MIENKFKKSEIGLIPKDWKETPIGLVANIINGSTPPTADAENYGGEYLFVSPADLGEHKYIVDTIKKLSSKGFAISRRLPSGSILYTCTGSTIGKCGIASCELTSNQQINAILPNDSYNNEYLYYAIQTREQDIRSNASVQAVPLINKAAFSKTLVAFPEKDEQSRIATALSDVDELIETLKKLIEKKRYIKQGAMQELLSGKRRLSGFTEKWVDVDFCNILYTQNSKSKQIEQKEYEVYGEYPIVDQGKTTIVGYTHRNDPIRKENGPYIIFGDHTCYFKFVDFDFFLGADGTQLLKCYTGYDTKFINYLCQRLVLPNTGYDRHFKYLKEVVFTIPRSVVEQQAIATILSEMDDEISMLESRLTKYQSMKQGMMQQLLTGKIRLI